MDRPGRQARHSSNQAGQSSLPVPGNPCNADDLAFTHFKRYFSQAGAPVYAGYSHPVERKHRASRRLCLASACRHLTPNHQGREHGRVNACDRTFRYLLASTQNGNAVSDRQNLPQLVRDEND